MNSVENLKSKFANTNCEIMDHAINNRLLFLLPHMFHPDLIEKELAAMLELDDEAQESINPSAFLKDKILD